MMGKVKVFTRQNFSDYMDAEYVYSTRHGANGPVANHQITVDKSELSDSLFKEINHMMVVSFNVVGAQDGYKDYYFVHDTVDGYVFQTTPSR